MTDKKKTKVVSLADKKFEKSDAGKVVKLCNALDEDVKRLMIDESVAPNAIIAAIVQRVGTYIGITDADIDKTVRKAAAIISRAARESRKRTES